MLLLSKGNNKFKASGCSEVALPSRKWFAWSLIDFNKFNYSREQFLSPDHEKFQKRQIALQVGVENYSISCNIIQSQI